MSEPTFEILSVDAQGATTSTSFATNPLKTYTIKVSGVVGYGGGGLLADAIWATSNSWGSWGINPVLGLIIDGVKIPQFSFNPALNPSHTYRFTHRGTGSPFTFQFIDSDWSNNSGS
ncbi:MAG: hypothetical protein ABI970_19830, partial [Chloroflexota bacterium]